MFLEINKKVVGQKNDRKVTYWFIRFRSCITGRITRLAKTLAINTLSKTISGSFNRIQFTPDLLPSDVIGTLVYNIKDGNFNIKKVLFLNFILADEIRAPAKVQSALLEQCKKNKLQLVMNQ